MFTSSAGALYGNVAPLPTPERFVPSRSRRTVLPNGRPRPTSTRGQLIPSAPHRPAVANVYGAHKALAAKWAWWRSSATPCGGANATRRPRQTNAGYIQVADVVEAIIRASGVRAPSVSRPGSRPPVEDVYSTLAGEAESSIELSCGETASSDAPASIHRTQSAHSVGALA